MKKLFLTLVLAAISAIGLNSCTPEPCPPGPCDSSCINAYKSGAVCNDGSPSTSTGSGTCSGHGGVNYWVYTCQ